MQVQPLLELSEDSDITVNIPTMNPEERHQVFNIPPVTEGFGSLE